MKLEFVIDSERSERVFSATCLAYVEANGLWSGGLNSGDAHRPVWALFAGTEHALRPFIANLRLGRKARVRDRERYEFLRSADYQFLWQREPEGAFVTVVLSDLFRVDPGMVDPERISFILLPSRSWLDAQAIDREAVADHGAKISKLPRDQLLELAPVAALFAVFVDRRTRAPIVADPRFHLQLLLACLEEGLVREAVDGRHYYYDVGFGFRQRGVTDVGLYPGLAMLSSHERFEQVLAEQTSLFFELSSG